MDFFRNIFFSSSNRSGQSHSIATQLPESGHARQDEYFQANEYCDPEGRSKSEAPEVCITPPMPRSARVRSRPVEPVEITAASMDDMDVPVSKPLFATRKNSISDSNLLVTQLDRGLSLPHDLRNHEDSQSVTARSAGSILSFRSSEPTPTTSRQDLGSMGSSSSSHMGMGGRLLPKDKPVRLSKRELLVFTPSSS